MLVKVPFFCFFNVTKPKNFTIMETKKSPKADLENKKSTYVLIGLVLSLSLLFICFEWSQNKIKKDIVKEVMHWEEPEVEPIPITTPPAEPQKVEPPTKVIRQIFEIVNSNMDIDTSKHFIVNNEPVLPVIPTIIIKDDDEPIDSVYQIVEVMPNFPGGEAALMSYISKSIKYPTIALETGIHGRVMVSFVIEKNGSISHVTIYRGIHKSLDDEAVRVVNSMPNWNPGKQGDKNVRTSFIVPIFFKLANS